jgi:hypothetical protein
MITALLLTLVLADTPVATPVRPGAVGAETCPFPAKLLPYRVYHKSTGKPIRSGEALREFKNCTGYPKGRPGWVIDHIFPLACGGPDVPENMIWQSQEDSRLKDRWERVRPGCGRAAPEGDLP